MVESPRLPRWPAGRARRLSAKEYRALNFCIVRCVPKTFSAFGEALRKACMAGNIHFYATTRRWQGLRTDRSYPDGAIIAEEIYCRMLSTYERPLRAGRAAGLLASWERWHVTVRTAGWRKYARNSSRTSRTDTLEPRSAACHQCHVAARRIKRVRIHASLPGESKK